MLQTDTVLPLPSEVNQALYTSDKRPMPLLAALLKNKNTVFVHMFLGDLELRCLRCMVTSILPVDSDRLETSFTVFGKTNLKSLRGQRVCMCIVYIYLMPEIRSAQNLEFALLNKYSSRRCLLLFFNWCINIDF